MGWLAAAVESYSQQLQMLDVRLIRTLAETYGGYDWFVDSHDHPRSREDVRELPEAASP